MEIRRQATARRAVIRGIALVATAPCAVPVALAQTSVQIVDAQAHLLHNIARGKSSATEVATEALRAMDRLNVQATIFAPPPFPPHRRGAYGLSELQSVARQHPGRFAFVAGGESLNPMLLETPANSVSEDATQRFLRAAEEIAQGGAAGFGELAVEHLSMGNVPYESSPADHPLLLALTDVAARYGMPVCLHMEAVPQDMPFPARGSGGSHPAMLKENIAALERLLNHSQRARIVWLHAGWDLTGERTVPLMRGLLGRHANLFMTIKSDQHGSRQTLPFLPGLELKPGWLEMLRSFPDRFAVGSDQFFDEVDADATRIEHARKLIDALPPDLARLVGYENARRIYRLPG